MISEVVLYTLKHSHIAFTSYLKYWMDIAKQGIDDWGKE